MLLTCSYTSWYNLFYLVWQNGSVHRKYSTPASSVPASSSCCSCVFSSCSSFVLLLLFDFIMVSDRFTTPSIFHHHFMILCLQIKSVMTGLYNLSIWSAHISYVLFRWAGRRERRSIEESTYHWVLQRPRPRRSSVLTIKSKTNYYRSCGSVTFLVFSSTRCRFIGIEG